MADDILERLWEWQDHKDGGEKSYALYLALGDAADEIERLRQQLESVWAISNLLATRIENISSGNVEVLLAFDKAQEKARRG